MVETNSVELAMKWLFSRPEDHVQEDDELARALASSLGSSSKTSKVESIDKSMDILTKEGQTNDRKNMDRQYIKHCPGLSYLFTCNL